MRFLRELRKWIEHIDGIVGKHNAIVCSRFDYTFAVNELHKRNDIAFISIEPSDDYATIVGESNSHYLTDAPNVLNVNFDDVSEDEDFGCYKVKAISKEQAEEIVDFIDNNVDKHFVIHCTAGVSRSQGVFRFIMDSYPDCFELCEMNKYNPCLTPNITVVSALKRAFRKKHFNDIEEDE